MKSPHFRPNKRPTIWGATLVAFLLSIGIFPADLRGAQFISLAGEWRFALDRHDAGVSEQWFAKNPGDKIQLPGVLEAQGYGDEIGIHTPWVLSLYDHFWYLRADYAAYTNAGAVKVPFICQPPRHYLGAAWYQRDFEIPTNGPSRHFTLFMERPHWESRVWLDDQIIGTNNSLCAPHEFDLGLVAPGIHRLTVRVDNRMILPYRPDAHSVSDSLDDAWNGIVGKIELRATLPLWIYDLQVYPHVATKSVTIRGQIGNLTGLAGTNRLGMMITPFRLDKKPRAMGATNFLVSWTTNGGSFETELTLDPSAELWDEFHPTIYRLAVFVEGGEPAGVHFGLREFKAKGQEFTLNDQPVYLRGTHFGGDFPLAGYPPTDVDSWKTIFKTCQDWGLNHMRFHSWCPPDAAFEAADQLGFYLQVECGMWNEFRPGGDMVKMLYAETDRIIQAYGNHPSFLLLSASNEAHGRWQQCLPQWVEHYRAADPRRLYTPDTGWVAIDRPGPVTGADYLVAGRIGQGRTRGETGWFGRDYGRSLRGVDVPVVAHELGQWCAYPDYDLIQKFTGFMRPGNFEIFRDSAARHGVLAEDKKFAQASGRFQLACYKEEIEANLRTPGLAGFQLLDLHDYTGQGTALVGLLDPLWQGKGYATPAEFKQFCNPVVPLARLTQRVFTTADPFAVDCEIANFGDTMENATPVWQIVDATGKQVDSGEWPARTIVLGKNISLGKITADLSKLAAPQKYQLVVSLKETAVSNSWSFWLYPAAITNPPPADVLVTGSWEEAAPKLAAGGKVLYLPRPVDLAWNSPPLARLPIFWNALMGPTWGRMLGLWCETHHPALAEFPTGPECDWQWTELTHNVRAMNLESLPSGLHPIVQAIDDWNRNYKLGLAFECRVGAGKLLVCSVDFSGLETHPVARQLYHSLLDYMGGAAFAPAIAATPEELRGLFLDTRIMHRLQATAEADGQSADDLIDGDPNTFWLSAAGGSQPHEITIHFPQAEAISGLVLMPRQNQREHQGDIREYRLDRSADGTNWTEIGHGELPSSFDPHTISFGQTLTVKDLKLTALSGFGTDTTAALAEVAVVYAGPKLADDEETIEYQRARTASPDIDAGGDAPGKPKR
jgi:hypothetical protein